MNQQSTSAIPTNGASSAHELFALTDEQILDLEPVADSTQTVPPESPSSSSVILSEPQASEGSQPQSNRKLSDDEILRDANNASPETSAQNSTAEHGARNTDHTVAEPPAWLAAQMKDPWTGEAARELWNGAQQAKQEAAAYRQAFATPEDARALKDLYPGGVNEARAASERARVLDDIDRAFFGATGKSAQQTSASREQLAQMMLREDPAAFREMVFAGLRVLEEAGKGASGNGSNANLPRLAQVFAANRTNQDTPAPLEARVAAPFRAASSSTAQQASTQDAGLKPAATNSTVGARHASSVPEEWPATHLGTSDAHVAAYAAFEKAANDDLERSVGSAIERTIAHALPNLKRGSEGASVGARTIVPLHDRLGSAVRQDVEAALKGDRQLGEQIAQILSGRRFDNETRAQVVRLIGERAQQLVPTAAKRVLNDWTQATLAAHRGQSSRSDAAAARRELEPAAALPNASSARTSSTATSARSIAPRLDARRVDYRKLSDEQILEL